MKRQIEKLSQLALGGLAAVCRDEVAGKVMGGSSDVSLEVEKKAEGERAPDGT